ncbi:stromal cell-derived factor 2 [Tenebrio molitor]|jgi:dolichyl-phosphate-mannose--protein O-mannosyl transferase|uniref:stromal cell-derived factor 2 n=1 Tax=Tenebrio molitor TaxID=7067 RepID=UPI0036248768
MHLKLSNLVPSRSGKMKNFRKLFCVTVGILCLNNYIPPIECAKQRYVTCGSVVKLMNTDYRVRLHSHDVKYGTGSGQQSVTATEVQEDINSHWVIKAESDKVCLRGEPIKCGSTIRLEHLETKKNLHSHHFSSPLSGYQEISCYGDNGEGDSGDHWVVICAGDSWLRDDSVMLKHLDTDMYLSASGKTFGRPINGQMEVVGVRSSTGSVHWQTMEGIFLHAADLAARHMHMAHTEL